ncbi:MAG TPA: FAD-dependent oxidoreductase [Kofleriaceae bacterium]|nr:FAD-dependent oxidoreductase [Kofleriaceae bacterium]
MKDAIVIGDGPGGLSAALFLAKNGLDVVVFGQDKTAMHAALLNNYLGLPAVLGRDFQQIARNQVTACGAEIRSQRVTAATKTEGGYAVTTDSGETLSARFLVLSEGKGPRLATTLGLDHNEETGIATDRNGHSKLDGVYVVGRSARPGRSQAIISAGDGAAAAIDILSRREGASFCDWDSPPEDG